MRCDDRLEVKVRRLRENAGALTLKAAVQTPAFTDETGDHELTLELLDLCPKGEVTRSWYLRAQSVPAPESVMLANHESIQAWVSGDKRTVEENFALRAAVVEASAVQIVDQAVTSASLEMRNMVGGQKYVALSEIILQRTRNAYLIEEIPHHRCAAIHTDGCHRRLATGTRGMAPSWSRCTYGQTCDPRCTSTVAVETAVKVMNDRGSFVVAVRLLEDSTKIVIPLRWVAI